MHRIDTKKRRAATLRYIAYAITLVLSIATTVVLLMIAQGYRIDRRSGQVVETGLLLVDNRPASAQIYIDGELRDGSAPGRFVLAAGSYELSLERSGYRSWGKTVELPAFSVLEVRYPLLVPTTLKSTSLTAVSAPRTISQSLDRKTLLVQQEDGTVVLVTPDLKEPRTVPLALGSGLRRENGNPGTLSVLEWSLNNKQVILRQQLPSGTEVAYALDTGKPEGIVDLTARFNLAPNEDLHYVGNKTDQFYGVQDQVLSRYNLRDGAVEPLLRRVQSYTPYADDTILFTRLNADGTSLESGLKKDSDTVVLERTPYAEGATVHLQYGKYDDHFYLAVASSAERQLTIYRNPLRRPILEKQLPLKRLEMPSVGQLKLAGAGRFLLARSGHEVLVYDFDTFKSYRYTLDIELAAVNPVSWLDDHHLLLTDTNYKHHMIDFDGTNQQELVASRPGSSLYFSNDYKSAYHYTERDASVQLSGFPMLVED